MASMDMQLKCLVHPTENSAYYDSDRQQVYCAQCLMENKDLAQMQKLKSLKKSYP